MEYSSKIGDIGSHNDKGCSPFKRSLPHNCVPPKNKGAPIFTFTKFLEIIVARIGPIPLERPLRRAITSLPSYASLFSLIEGPRIYTPLGENLNLAFAVFFIARV